MSQRVAVLTGDLIASTEAGQPATDAAIALVEAVATTEGTQNGIDTRFARFRGDGWQIYCSDPARVFRLTVLVLAHLQCRPDLPKTRISAATGPMAFLPQAGLASASGEAFSISGQTLDAMSHQRLLFHTDEVGGPWKSALFSYLEWQSARWSPEQAEAVAIAFRHTPSRPKDVADALGISRQAAAARLQGAGFGPLSETEISFQIAPIS